MKRRRVPEARAAAATLVAELGRHEGHRLTKAELQEALGVGSWTFGRALADARLSDYVTIKAGTVELTAKALDVLELGLADLESNSKSSASG